MSYLKEREEVAAYCRRVFERNLAQGNGGNISVRLANGNFAIKATGKNLGLMTAEDVLIVDPDGKVLEGAFKPSMETGFHLGIYELRPEVNAIIHSHPVYSIALANSDTEIPTDLTITTEFVLGYVPIAGYAAPGSSELRDIVVNCFRDNPESKAIMMKNHGICCVGKNLEDAYNTADELEASAHIKFLQDMYGCSRICDKIL